MAKLVWDQTGEKFYETGAKNCALYVQGTSGTYPKGVAWNGLTKVTESPSGAEASPIYADDQKYINLISAEQFGATIEAYTYPDEFGACDGSIALSNGVNIGQQARKSFGLVYKTTVGNDVDGNDYGYKLHIIYGALAAPSKKEYGTINEKPDAITFSWEVTTTPVNVTGKKPTATLIIDSTKVDKDKLTALEKIIYGDENNDARLPLPDEVATIFNEALPTALSVVTAPLDKATGVSVSASVVLTFNNAISKESILVTSSTGSIVDVNKTFDTAHKVLTIKPSTGLAATTTYLVNLIGITDIYGQSLVPAVSSFTTV